MSEFLVGLVSLVYLLCPHNNHFVLFVRCAVAVLCCCCGCAVVCCGCVVLWCCGAVAVLCCAGEGRRRHSLCLSVCVSV